MGNFRIKEFRRALGINQWEMAQVIGLTQSNLSRYETNDIDLTEEQVASLRKAYGKETVDKYVNEEPQKLVLNYEPNNDHSEQTLLSVIKRQNDTIAMQSEQMSQFTQQLSKINERLLSLLEKIQFD